MSDPASALKSNFKQVVQIGAVVNDLDKSIETLSGVFGIGPFSKIDDWPPDRPDFETYYCPAQKKTC